MTTSLIDIIRYCLDYSSVRPFFIFNILSIFRKKFRPPFYCLKRRSLLLQEKQTKDIFVNCIYKFPAKVTIHLADRIKVTKFKRFFLFLKHFCTLIYDYFLLFLLKGSSDSEFLVYKISGSLIFFFSTRCNQITIQEKKTILYAIYQKILASYSQCD
jgi:hypothetical protein